MGEGIARKAGCDSAVVAHCHQTRYVAEKSEAVTLETKVGRRGTSAGLRGRKLFLSL
jgi:hypothetical protein